jgi:hypothetical protein
MQPTTEQFSLPTLVRKKIEKLCRNEKDVRIHKRLSALLWLNQGYAAEEVANLLDVCPRTVKNWIALYLAEGLEALCSLEYIGDPGHLFQYVPNTTLQPLSLSFRASNNLATETCG